MHIFLSVLLLCLLYNPCTLLPIKFSISYFHPLCFLFHYTPFFGLSHVLSFLLLHHVLFVWPTFLSLFPLLPSTPFSLFWSAEGMNLFIGKAVQKSYLEVTEEGAEGAAGSGALICFISHSLSPLIIFSNIITRNSDTETLSSHFPLHLSSYIPLFISLLPFSFLHHTVVSLSTKSH